MMLYHSILVERYEYRLQHKVGILCIDYSRRNILAVGFLPWIALPLLQEMSLQEVEALSDIVCS